MTYENVGLGTLRTWSSRALLFAFVFYALVAAGAYGWYRVTPRGTIAMPNAPLPRVAYDGDAMAVKSPTGILVADIGGFRDQFLAYLYFDYLRSRRVTAGNQVLLAMAHSDSGPRYRVRMVLQDDIISAVPYLAGLQGQGYIDGFELRFLPEEILRYEQQQTAMFVATYTRPEIESLEAASDEQLIAPVARFLLFKSQTDPRVRIRNLPGPTRLTREEAQQLAADIIAVSRFYSLPLDVMLGVGAMENNYMTWAGDLRHTVWKSRPDHGDIVLERRRGRVLVRNYALGVWQMTRETLRHAHQLYLRDTRDYALLPAHLQPDEELDVDTIRLPVITTYAGLFLRDLLDRSGGDVQQAVGAYNRSLRNPNLEYAAGVKLVGDYARRMLERELVLRKRPFAPDRFLTAGHSRPRAPVAVSVPLIPAD